MAIPDSALKMIIVLLVRHRKKNVMAAGINVFPLNNPPYGKEGNGKEKNMNGIEGVTKKGYKEL